MNAPLLAGFVAVAALLPPTGDPSGPHRGRRPARGETVRRVRLQSAAATTGDTPPGMSLIQNGSFRMGVPMAKALELAAGDNGPRAEQIVAMAPDHLVLVDAFFLDRFEVTNAQYDRWLRLSEQPVSDAVLDFDFGGRGGDKPTRGLPAGREELPVRGVTFDEASRCARWLGKRLPTEPEWEFAARRGRAESSYYPWGDGWSAWQRGRCADYDAATKQPGPPRTFRPGTFKDDVAADGIFDLCGNVAEWTSSRFVAYPGFAAPTVKDRFGRRVVQPPFDRDACVVRGGCSNGDGVSNNVVARTGQRPAASAEYLGFRAAVSFLPGLDALRAAVDELVLAHVGLRQAIDLGSSSIGAETVWVGDEESGVLDGSSTLAFARLHRIAGLYATVREESVGRPVVVGILALDVPALSPQIRPGSYLVAFKARGRTREQERQISDLRRHKSPAQGSGRSDRAAEEGEPTGLLSIPPDVDALVFLNRRGEFCGFVPTTVSESALFATRLAVERDAADASRDHVRVTFGAQTANRSLQPQFVLDLAFAAGVFEPTAAR
jgi:formylglycine-generating enzyme required for sulfatase activity